jgi:RHS repeat-associated protein
LLTGDRANTANDEAYGYDGAGNRTQANGATYTTTANNRLTDDGTFTYTYDDEGNVETKVRKSSAQADDKTVVYQWDYRNRLEKVTFKRNDGTVTKTVEYFYDMFNRLTRREIDADGAGPDVKVAEQFMHDGEEMVLHGVPNGGLPWRSFMRGPGQDMVLFESRDALRVFLGDHLNTIRDVVDTSGNIVNHLTIDSFGRRIDETNGNIEVMIGLGGRPYDEDTRLQNHVNRWYSVDTGRWLSEDPIGFAGGNANLYAYVGNSPVMWGDPSGLFEQPGSNKRTWQVHNWKDLGTLGAFRVFKDRDGNEFVEYRFPNGTTELTGPGDRPATFGRDGEPTIRIDPNAPSLAEPSAEALAWTGIAVATGGAWGAVKEWGQAVIDSVLGPAPGPAPGRPGGGVRNGPADVPHK